MSGVGKVVCVIGASGYVASWVVKVLLERGYTVKATVRNHRNPSKIAHLKALEGADERLTLFEANLLEDGSFDSVVEGCVGVFHTASPVFLKSTDPQAELIEPALKGTINVLRSCSKVPSIKRVVLTGSMASVILNRNLGDPDIVMDETWFSDPEYCEEIKMWYHLSKTLAEQAAWKFAEENGIDLVVLNPGFVIGPLLQPTLNFSSDCFLDIIKGNEVYSPYSFVDARDVAYSHAMAFENPSASGRYCLVETTLTYFEVLQILNKLYPSLNLHISDKGNPPPFQVSKKKAQSLGINFTPVEVSIKDTVESLKEKNFLSL